MRIVLVLVLVAACSSGDDGPPAEFRDARAQFDAGSHASYSFTWKEDCFCGDPVTRATRVSVAAGQISKTTYVDDGSPAQNTRITTIEGMFDWIEDAYGRHYDEIDISYDAKFGYPTMIYFDPYKQMVDEETRIALSQFVAPADSEGQP